jgi:hypothetical protein
MEIDCKMNHLEVNWENFQLDRIPGHFQNGVFIISLLTSTVIIQYSTLWIQNLHTVKSFTYVNQCWESESKETQMGEEKIIFSQIFLLANIAKLRIYLNFSIR